jgi:hypothetical protein
MGKRHDFLDRLWTGELCAESWDGMAGGDSCRFCSRCRRNVFDFARMTPGQIAARLAASRGKVCARLTRSGGKLLTLPAVRPAPARRRKAGKRSPFAAALLGAFLGAGAAAAQPAMPAPAAGAPALDAEAAVDAARPAKRGQERHSPQDAVLSGHLVNQGTRALAGAEVILREVASGRERLATTGADGGFLFERLPAGLYDLDAEIDGYVAESVRNLLLEAGKTRQADLSIYLAEETFTTGVTISDDRSLRQRFEESDLAVIAVVEGSEVLGVEAEIVAIVTRLRILNRFKGEQSLRRVSYLHWEPVSSLDQDAEDGTAVLFPGEELLAFLRHSEDEDAAGKNYYQEVGFDGSIRRLSGAERASYLRQLEELAELGRAARKCGKVDPSAVVDWLVATAEDPFTRGDAALELAQALDALEKLADSEGRQSAALARDLLAAADDAGPTVGENGDGLRLVFLGAALTPLHQHRLEAALAAAEKAGSAELLLYQLVRGWNPSAADSWLAVALRGDGEIAGDTFEAYLWLRDLAAELGTDQAAAFADSADERWDALAEEEENEAQAALIRVLRHELADLL